MANKAAIAAAAAMFGKQPCISGGYRNNCPRGADCLYTHYDDPPKDSEDDKGEEKGEVFEDAEIEDELDEFFDASMVIDSSDSEDERTYEKMFKSKCK